MKKFRPAGISLQKSQKLLNILIVFQHAIVAQLVEHVIGNDEVTGSIPVNGSLKHFVIKMFRRTIRLKRIVLATVHYLKATLAQLVEHHFRKVGVPSSILGGGSWKT